MSFDEILDLTADVFLFYTMRRTIGKASLPSCLASPLKLYLLQPLPQHNITVITPFTIDPATFPRKGPVLLPEHVLLSIDQNPLSIQKAGL